jgi:hypothetical protein
LPTFESLSSTVTSCVLEGIAQNTSGSIFKAEVTSHSHHSPPFAALKLHR